ncbi:MAG TPA: AbrB/MazE/SpoVT family DNA-binding domain-containing protein [Patescibacteria group bacterium]|nr:AbrB/MazE/SpoVT family DNA-binding domain-containing protein [Patescibacteria group bacterium]
MTKNINFGHCFGATALGERGQLVVPKKIRDHLHLKKGDNFIAFEKMGAIVFAPVSIMDDMMQEFSRQLKKIKK